MRGRGNVLVVLNRYEEALAAYDKALSIKPGSAGAWLGRGNVYLDLKPYDEAVAAYDKALSIERDLAEAHHGIFFMFSRETMKPSIPLIGLSN